MKLSSRFLLFSLLLAVLCGCNPLKRLKENEYLVNKNTIRIDNKNIKEVELSPIIKQKPNRRVFKLVRFHLAVYNMFNYGKENKVKNWIKNTIGEPPVIFDTSLTKKTAAQMEQALKNKGYFDAIVTDSVIKKKSKKVNVIYKVTTKEPYIIDSLSYQCADSALYSLLVSDLSHSLLRQGMDFNTNTLQNERDRITKVFRNQGYYYFNKEYIVYEVDSNYSGNRVSLDVKINRINENNPDLKPENHKQYKINQISVLTSYSSKFEDTIRYDTVAYRGLNLLHEKKKIIVKSSTLRKSITFEPEELYNAERVDQSYQKLNSLNIFKFINVKFIETGKPGYLDCQIQLSPLLKQSFSIETEGTHSLGGNLGIGGNVNYRNKNLFKGAELLEFKIKGGLEFQRNTLTTETAADKKLFLFNTIEIGPELNLSFQKFLLPIRVRNKKILSPTTTITTAYNYQLRPEFERKITNFSFNYNWRKSTFSKFIVTLFEINGVKIENIPLLTERLRDISDQTLLNSYKSHLTTATRFTYIFNNQEAIKQPNVTFFTGNIEFAGNTLRAFNSFANSIQKEEGSYLIFGLRYAQYVRNELDYRIYRSFLNNNNVIAFRAYTGLGVPYGNSKSLPFIKTFFVGGSTDIKAWEYRRLGPGSYHSTELEAGIEQTGDIKLETNAEYRFNIIKFNQNFIFEGAAFVDAGNVWILNPDLARPGANFSDKRFYKEFAVGGGIGARLNFGFFVIRLDYAKKLRDPSLPEGERWVGNKISTSTGLYNFGIGYPF